MENETKEGGFRRNKMREAMEKIYLYAQSICEYKDEPDMVCRRADLIERIVNAALAEPERNCDLFESPKNETDEQEQKIWDAYNKWCNNPRNRNIDNFPIHSIVGWLLAPAHVSSEEIDMQISR